MILKPSYAEIGLALAHLQQEKDTAEFHGQFCGQLIANSEFNATHWLAEAVIEQDMQSLLAREHLQTVWNLVERTQQELSLDELNFSFSLLLPEVEVSSVQCGIALSEWVSGFLYGCGLELENESPGLDDADVREIIFDFQRIVSECRTITEEHTIQEEDIQELIEYVSLGVQMIHATFHSKSSDKE